MNRLVVTLAVIAAALVVPASASALNFEVNTEDDLNLGTEACTPTFNCSFHDAIDRANETAEADEITFGELFAGKFEPEAPLPPIIWPVEIDATTAADYSDAGHPVLLLSGEAISDPEKRGLEFGEDAGGSSVEGLAVGGFRLGIFTYAEAGVDICANYVGVETDGETALPNVYAGISTGATGAPTQGARIGGAGCAGNLISGNTEFGILEAGEDTVIKGNSIGVDAEGEPLPNGDSLLVSAGIEVNAIAKDPVIGGIMPGEGNLIAYNEGQGIRVRDSASTAKIRGNSIHSNLLSELQIDTGLITAVPELKFVSSDGVKAKAQGAIVDAAPNEQYAVDVFVNAACPSGEPAGETYLGEVAVETDATGFASFSTESLAPAPPGSELFTTTATPAVTGSTSTFSACFDETPAPPPPAPPVDPPTQPIVQIQPVNGESVVVAPAGGKVFVQRPGEKKPTELKEGQTIPVGSIVDATNGKVTLTSVNKAGETQTAVFYGGKFLVAQQEGSGLVVLKLRGSLKGCPKAGDSSATASGKKGRRLWGSGKGKFRTEGNYGSATVRGTVWLTEDRCTGTFFKVRKGVVTVRDFPAKSTVSLGKGKSYFAKP
ncbi:MAG TPA: right-handed parallel beta-helix repeat-containing protein [Solirubrobacterales bacterium]|nr:right-handed parallel beta-helix repeat-containing protein [Solirubrobacterales bacterium]